MMYSLSGTEKERPYVRHCVCAIIESAMDEQICFIEIEKGIRKKFYNSVWDEKWF